MNASSAARHRPKDETAGSPQRSPRQLTGAVLSFDLGQEIASLQQESAWQTGDRNSRTLVGGPRLRAVLVVLKEGARIKQHQTDGWVTIQTLQGYVRVETMDETVDLTAGRLLTLESGVPHDVSGVEQSAFLLTIG
jgi:quercetin dioxygenase-like cupin family protein